MAGLREISGEQKMLGTLVRVIHSGKQAVGWGDVGDGENGRREHHADRARGAGLITTQPTLISRSGLTRMARPISETRRSR